MMMPSLTPSSSSSSGSATVRVDKATSEFLSTPDWTLNMDICDAINYNQPLAKDVVKALKKRLQHKNPKVQLLSLTLLETMVKNCGDYVHFQIADRDILQEMIKIVKRKADMHVRDKILVLLDSWQEAFGGPGGKYPQYYWAYDELRRYGVGFPPRSRDSAPIFTPPVTHPTSRTPQPGYGMPVNSSPTLDEAMAADVENLSLSSLQSIRDVGDLLADMLQAVDPTDRLAVKDELIVDLVERCRSSQKKLMQMLTTTVDEELLAQGLDLNDILQVVLAKHDAIASGSPLPDPMRRGDSKLIEKNSPILQPDNVEISTSSPMPTPSAPVAENKGQDAADEEEEDDFAQLARRHSKAQSFDPSFGVGEGSPSDLSSALVLADPPRPVKTTKEQDMIDFLSLTLSTDTLSPKAPQTSGASAQEMNQAPVSQTATGATYHPQPHSQAYVGNQVPVMNNYVAPWARSQPGAPLQSQSQLQHHAQNAFQPQTQPQYQTQLQPNFQAHPQFQSQPQPELHSRFQPQAQFQSQPLAHGQTQHQNQQLVEFSGQPQHQSQYQYSQNMSAYPPPPWAPTPGYYSNPSTSYRSSAPSNSQYTSTPVETMGQMQHPSSFPGREGNRLSLNGDVHVPSGPRSSAPAAGQKAFVPSYRLFEDLNVLGNNDGRQNAGNASQPSYRLYGARSEN